ncbi:succinylglutamate desuccinylase [Asticcacaulis sp. AC402]|nr:succinylglutamate desuccinylase [Asticcacaulis sp. AC402]
MIERLDVADLPVGRTKLWFRALDNPTGQAWYVPVVVVKGEKPGPDFLLTAGIHGDELNGIAVIQRLTQEIDPRTLSGAVVAIPGLNTPGLLHSTRTYTSSHGGAGGNLNRLIPSDPEAVAGDTDAATRFAARLWSQLFMGNADFAIDLHTQSRGGTYAVYVFAQTKAARHLGDLLRPDVINMDPGIEGAVENMLNGVEIPAVTYELGTAESWDEAYIGRAMAGIRNVMIDAGMLTGQVATAGPAPFVGNETRDVSSPHGGWAHSKVRLNQDVKAGEVMAVITNAFGDVTATLKAPFDARVIVVPVDPRTDPGETVIRLLRWNDTLPCKLDGCPTSVDMVKDN